MTKEKFIEDLSDLLETDVELTLTTNLKEVEEYDSLAIMGLVAYADRNFGKKIPGEKFGEVTDVQSLIDILGAENFE
ncbi:MAG: acyl carrier protein [Lentisphaeria bacterium]|nr:acyl carrier protein [Lentisphaeria bacterium]